MKKCRTLSGKQFIDVNEINAGVKYFRLSGMNVGHLQTETSSRSVIPIMHIKECRKDCYQELGLLVFEQM